MAMQNGADVETIRELVALQRDIEANEARKAYVTAMTAFKSEPLTIRKTKHVKFGNTEYNHAELADVTKAVIDGLSKFGLSHRWDISQDGGKVAVSCIVTHELGHSESVTIAAEPDSSGSKNKIQAIGSTVSYLQRYTLLAITGLAAHDIDDDGRGSQSSDIPAKKKGRVTQDDVDNVRLFVASKGLDEKAVDEWIGNILRRNAEEHRNAEFWDIKDLQACRDEFKRWNREGLWPVSSSD